MWRKSSYSYPEGACVEIARPSLAQVLFRDSKVHEGPCVAVFSATAAAFVSALNRGDL
ncbi:hypothetical protein B1H18_06175 [Streptomyces tsukubensis]|uniref:DUF397 domain-containing protein n=2 Tax=Streptomyces tsukubensis TaxID=83656 RepID=A0A1V4AEM6_9ACTN|nr:hypothetical protein B1H18_06175 [Streptomyces tsukubensis]